MKRCWGGRACVRNEAAAAELWVGGWFGRSNHQPPIPAAAAAAEGAAAVVVAYLRASEGGGWRPPKGEGPRPPTSEPGRRSVYVFLFFDFVCLLACLASRYNISAIQPFA